jgi:beta-glucanase (GH16 family)
MNLACTILSLSTILTVSSFAQLRSAEPVWRDEFEGTKLDYTHWECEVNAFGGGNQELQLYTDRPENVRVENGLLILEARRDQPNISGTLREYSSARLRTKHRGDWRYGRFDIRAKLPKGNGIWPAIWMLPTEEKYGGWALSGEIDILEFKGHEPNTIYGSLHFGAGWPRNRFTTGTYALPASEFSDDFHIYSLDWRRDKITWLVDDKPYQTLSKWDTEAAAFPAPFDQSFHLLLNLAVGGGFVGNPDSSTQFPQRFEIDYVRVLP